MSNSLSVAYATFRYFIKINKVTTNFAVTLSKQLYILQVKYLLRHLLIIF